MIVIRQSSVKIQEEELLALEAQPTSVNEAVSGEPTPQSWTDQEEDIDIGKESTEGVFAFLVNVGANADQNLMYYR